MKNTNKGEIYNTQGVCLLKKTPCTEKETINISFLPDGIYIIRTSDGSTVINSKFTKQ